MDKNFCCLNSLLYVLDSELHGYMNSRYNMNQDDFENEISNEDLDGENHYLKYNSQFYFTYRWFLLDFKREFVYQDIFKVWETIWSAKHICTENFSLFIALALVKIHRLTIMDNHMDFTDIIQYFNELSEKHDFDEALDIARIEVDKLNQIILNNMSN